MKNNFLSRWSQRKLDADKDVTSTQTNVDEQNADAQIVIDKQLVTDKQLATDNQLITDRKVVTERSESAIAVDSNTAPGGFKGEGESECRQPTEDNTEGLVTESQASCDRSEESEQDDVPVESLSMSELMTKTGIDKAAKKAALRKMFLSPEFNVVDRLNDYDHDYAAVKPLAAGVAETLREWVNKVEELDSEPVEPENVASNQEDDVLTLDNENANDEQQVSCDDALEAEQVNNAEVDDPQHVTDAGADSSVSCVNAEIKLEPGQDDGVDKS
ncbi:DUF3306 domain-containing protein [Vibrio methylphosphonaticus]|uniref:DUF3306 domain-containing protein n=1 Tax=Vibrio methylphosphonaticus TaxID=2946866 RepID=UPI00202A2AD8|nr:DUF3306 domain-containing protein [Vibrio methylphosphonaticus]MCL9776783.1 DUF3306 domain-containing protein [Vibrio methylphosphonaticus]